MTDVLGYLQSKGLELRPAPNLNVRTLCFFHGEEGEPEHGRLYIKVDPEADVPGLLYCLAGETKVITRNGTFPIRELSGSSHELLVARDGNSPGLWKEAPVRSFGVQRLSKITLRRNGVHKVIRATPEHRWFLKDGRELTTSELKPGHTLATNNYQRVSAQYGSGWMDNCSHAIARGFIYGDGTVQHKGSVAYLYGEKKQRCLAPYFGNDIPWGYPDQDVVRYSGFPRFYKTEVPDVKENPAYLHGWLAGYFAADGYFNAQSGMELYSVSRDSLEAVRDICNVLGIRTQGVREYSRIGFNGIRSNLCRISIFPDDVGGESFFLIDSHREAFNSKASYKYTRMRWVVESIEDTGESEEVFCAVVKEYGNFTLEDHILTGNCHVCEASGSLNKIKRHFGDFIGEDEASKGRKVQVLIAAADYYYDCLTKDSESLSYLTDKRGLSVEAIERFKLGVSDGKLNDHLLMNGFKIEDIRASGLVWDTGRDFFGAGNIMIPYFDQGKCVQIRGRDRTAVKNKYKTPPGQPVLLFNTDTLMEGEEVILTEGEFDAMILEDLGYSAIGVPGAKLFQAEWIKFFSAARRVYICFDSDPPGVDGAEKVSAILGAKARIVKMPEASPGESKVDPTEYVVGLGNGKDAFDLLLRSSRSGHIIRVEDAFEAWLDREGNSGLTGLKLGIEKLDAVIKPGLLPGQLMIPLARTGSGKSIAAINIMQRMIEVNPEVKILFISLEQTRNEWFERARRIHGFYHGDLDIATELNQSTINFYRNNLLMVDKNRLTIDELRTCIRQSEDELGDKIAMVVVDYLGYWARAFKGEPYVRTTDAVMGLKEVAKDTELVIFSPHQVNRGSQPGMDIKMNDARESVVGSTRVLLADGSYVPIKDLVGQSHQVASMTRGYGFETVPTVKIWEKSTRKTFKVTTKTGRSFSATPEHPMLTADEEWVELSKLDVGDHIAIPGDIPIFGGEHTEHAELIGNLIADGGLTTSPISYTEGVSSVRDHVLGLARDAGVNPSRRKGSEIGYFLSVSSVGGCYVKNPVTNMIRGLGLFGVKSPDRFIPQCIFRSCKEDVASCLRGLWSSDGGIVRNQGLKYSSASLRLARDVQHLLSRFGIQSVLRQEEHGKGAYQSSDRPYWTVVVNQAESICKFRDQIGLAGVKQDQLEEIAEEKSDCGLAHSIDLFPASLYEEIHSVRKSNGLGWSALSRTGNPRRTSIVKTRRIRRDKLRWMATQVGSKRLKDLAESPLYFDEIISIEEGATEPVYDITVVGYRNFVGDFVFSNSGSIEETADFLLSIMNTDKDPGKTIQTSTGDIVLHLLKSRHGGDGTQIELKFAPTSLAMVPQADLVFDDTYFRKAMNEVNWRRSGEYDYDRVYRMHSTGDRSLISAP